MISDFIIYSCFLPSKQDVFSNWSVHWRGSSLVAGEFLSGGERPKSTKKSSKYYWTSTWVSINHHLFWSSSGFLLSERWSNCSIILFLFFFQVERVLFGTPYCFATSLLHLPFSNSIKAANLTSQPLLTNFLFFVTIRFKHILLL